MTAGAETTVAERADWLHKLAAALKERAERDRQHHRPGSGLAHLDGDAGPGRTAGRW